MTPNGYGAPWPQSLLDEGEMGTRILEFDWSKTAAGPIESWPATLRAFVGTILAHDFPMYIFWGEQNVGIYNGAYSAVAGDKHPAILGMRTQDAWPEVWDDIEPLLARVKAGKAVTIENFELTLMRFGFPEQFFHTVCYSPLRDGDGKVSGALATFTETTAEVLGRRRLETLRRIASSANPAISEADYLRSLAQALADDPDVPAALLYLTQDNDGARLAISVGNWSPATALPERIPLAEVVGGCVEAQATPFVSHYFRGLYEQHNSRIVAAPICASPGGAPIGVLIARLSDRLRVDDPYLGFVGLLAAQIGASVGAARAAESERAGTEARLVSRAVERIGTLAESGRHLFWMARPDGWIDWYARGWYDYTGQSEEEARGWGWDAAHHPEDLPEVMRRWAESIAKGEPFEMTFRLRGRDGRYRWFLTRAVPETDAEGRVVRWYGTNTDVDEERRASRQLDAFARIGERTTEMPTAKDAVAALCDVLVPQFADWTLVNLVGADGALSLADARHADEAKMRLLQSQVGERYDLPGHTTASQEVFRLGRPMLFERISPHHAAARTKPAFAAVVESVGLDSAVVVPIVAAGKALGTFHAMMGGSGRAYEERDLPFFEEIGRRIGSVLHNVRLFERESRLAESFQNAALPSGMPAVPGMRFSALYRPAEADAKIGGDFHDAFRLLDGRVVVCIGDVAGTGLEAAATMAALRQSIRAAASINPDPDLMLKAADAVFAEPGRAPFATAFVGVIDPVTFSLRYANAGHPRPMLRAPDGSVGEFEQIDLLLGSDVAEREGSRTVGEAQLAPGCAVVLYTDGLTEACGDIDAGERALRNAVSRLAPEASADAAVEIHDCVLGGAPSQDDIALLVTFFDEPLAEAARERVLSWRLDSSDAEAASAARCEMTEALARAGLGADDIFAAEMIFSELLGNALRYAPGRAEIVLDVTQRAPVLHVLDDGRGFVMNPKLPAEPFSERGRGLFIVTKLAREFTSSTRTRSGGSHARAVLAGRVGRHWTPLRRSKPTVAP